MLLTLGNPFEPHEDIFVFADIVPTCYKQFGIFLSLLGRCSEGLDAFMFFFKP